MSGPQSVILALLFLLWTLLSDFIKSTDTLEECGTVTSLGITSLTLPSHLQTCKAFLHLPPQGESSVLYLQQKPPWKDLIHHPLLGPMATVSAQTPPPYSQSELSVVQHPAEIPSLWTKGCIQE